jgi:hypothetical protein
VSVFGPPRQIGHVVRDIERSMRHWIDHAGVGPWFLAEHAPILEATRGDCSYRLDELEGLRLSVALAHSGDMQIELIAQADTLNTPWRQFLEQGREGLHHWSSWETDYDRRKADALRRGYRLEMEGMVTRGRFAYFAHDAAPQTLIEMADYTPERRVACERIRAAALGWDGSDPIRRI